MPTSKQCHAGCCSYVHSATNPCWAAPLTFALPHSHQSSYTELPDYHLTSIQLDSAFFWLCVILPNPVDGTMLLIPYTWLLSGMGFSRAQKWEAGLGTGMGKIYWGMIPVSSKGSSRFIQGTLSEHDAQTWPWQQPRVFPSIDCH